MINQKNKLLTLKVGPKAGDRFPRRYKNNANIGHYFHNQYKKFFPVQDGKGADVKDWFEIKSKEFKFDKTQSSWTIGSMMEEDILTTNWKNSHIHEKLQVQVQILYTKNPNQVRNVSVYDFSKNCTQALLEQDYNNIVNKLNAHSTVQVWEQLHGKHMHIERVEDTDQWKFRLTKRQMQMLKNAENFNNIFTIKG